MTITRLVGFTLIAAPYVGVAGLAIYSLGWLGALFVFGVTALMVGSIVLGVRLVHS